MTAQADPTGKIANGAVTLFSLPSGPYTLAYPPASTFSTMYITNAAYDASVTSFTGGSNPTITFLFDRQGADGNWYPILPASGANAITLAAGTLSASVDIGMFTQAATGGGNTSLYGAYHNVFTPVSRIRWLFGGTSAPGTVSFSMSVIGR